MAGPYKLDGGKMKKRAISKLAKGESMTRVARELGVGVSSVSRWSRKQGIRELIEQEAQRYALSLPDATAISQNLLQAGRRETEKLLEGSPGTIDHKIIAAAAEEGASLRRAVGILPTPSGSRFTVNFFGDSEVSLSPILLALLRQSVPQIDTTDTPTTDEGGQLG